MTIFLLDYLADLVRRGDVASEAALREELWDPMRRYVRRALQPDTVADELVDDIRAHARQLVGDSGGLAGAKGLVDLISERLCELVIGDMRTGGLRSRS